MGCECELWLRWQSTEQRTNANRPTRKQARGQAGSRSLRELGDFCPRPPTPYQLACQLGSRDPGDTTRATAQCTACAAAAGQLCMRLCLCLCLPGRSARWELGTGQRIPFIVHRHIVVHFGFRARGWLGLGPGPTGIKRQREPHRPACPRPSSRLSWSKREMPATALSDLASCSERQSIHFKCVKRKRPKIPFAFVVQKVLNDLVRRIVISNSRKSHMIQRLP